MNKLDNNNEIRTLEESILKNYGDEEALMGFCPTCGKLYDGQWFEENRRPQLVCRNGHRWDDPAR